MEFIYHGLVCLAILRQIEEELRATGIMLAIYPSLAMHEMSKWEFVLNNPEWVAVFASAVFAVFTIVVIVWQVGVMKAQVRVMVWQGRNSSRHESIQNRLIQSQNRLFR